MVDETEFDSMEADAESRREDLQRENYRRYPSRSIQEEYWEETD